MTIMEKIIASHYFEIATAQVCVLEKLQDEPRKGRICLINDR